MAKSPSTIKLPFLVSKPPEPAVISQICGWADEGEIERAGKEAERQFRAGRYCAHIFKIWLVSRLVGRGLAELPRILCDLEAQVRTDDGNPDAEPGAWERGLAWLAVSLRERMKFHLMARDAVWQAWCAELDQALDTAVCEALARLQAPVPPLADARTEARLRSFGEEIELLYGKTFGPLLEQARAAGEPSDQSEDHSADAAPEDREPPAPEAVAHNSEALLLDSQSRGSVDFEEIEAPSSRFDEATRQPFRSGPLDALRVKLAAFERLAESATWPLAAMVARDIEQELSQFDPIRYLPDLFSGYLRTLSEVGGELEEYMQQGGSLEAQALERLYRADPAHFLSELSLREAAGA